MPNWNPNYPLVLGNEWLMNRNETNRVYGGSEGRMLRLPSTVTQTITELRMCAHITPEIKADTWTVIDVIEEGDETTPDFSVYDDDGDPVGILSPDSDRTVNGWRTNSGSSTNLFAQIDFDESRWPGPAQFSWIENRNSNQAYECTFDASAFDSGGALDEARIGWVEIGAIYGANTGFRKLRTSIVIDGTEYEPAGSGLRDVHGYGATYIFWWGELNPATELPWTPADIADFGQGGSSFVRVRSQTATDAKHPRIFALKLRVHHIPIENRAAVGVWRRPSNLRGVLNNIATDALVTMPAGTPNWAKQSGRNYLFYWRESISPAMWSASKAEDVRWEGCYQDFRGTDGVPAGIVYPLHHSGSAPPPSDVIASDKIVYDHFGRPQEEFQGRSRVGFTMVPIVTGGLASVDSQPYRLTLADLEFVRAGKKVGQRVVPSTTTNWQGFRMPIVPPESPGTSNLTVSVHRVSDGVQVGGSFTISAADVRKIPDAGQGMRYLSGFFSAGATLQAGTAYEIRVSADGTSRDYIVMMPDSSLGNSASFGGQTHGAYIGDTHFANRALSINLLRQPDPPENLLASIVSEPINTFVSNELDGIEHVQIDWDEPDIGMGSAFTRYEIERSIDGGEWRRVANINNSSTTSWVDHEAPRDVPSTYRVRAIGRDGRISPWEESDPVTPKAPGSLLVLTSNHRPDMELVYLYQPEATFPILSAARDEIVTLHGTDNQVVFMESEDRGVGWATEITVNQITLAGRGGLNVFDPLIALVRALDIPYVCAMDHQGTHILGHVAVSDASEARPQHRYKARIEVTPTHTNPVPVEVD